MMLSDFVGNAHVVRAVSNMFSSRRIPHAVIIEGEDGLGKHILAGIIAQAAVCSEDNPPCGKCRECQLAEKNIHPDIQLISPDGATIKVDQMRALRQDVFIMPNQAARRVFIIESAEKMNDSAANAILKILEEPPEYAMFILLSRSAGALLPTIVSRSVVLSLSAPDFAAAAEYVKKIAPDKDAAEIESAVTAASGNIGLAIKLLESGNSEWAFTDRLLEITQSGTELELLRELHSLEGKNGRERINLVMDELQNKIERLIAEKVSGKTARGAGSGIPPARLAVMRDAVITAKENNAANAGVALLLTNLCACFKAPMGV